MKKKINEMSLIRNDDVTKTSIYSYYKKQFEKILSLNDARQGTLKEKQFYIHDIQLEKELEAIFDDSTDTISFLIGYAGIGKSTSLRQFFQFRSSEPVLQQEKTVLVFPVTFNSVLNESNIRSSFNDKKYLEAAYKIKDELAFSIEALCSFLEDNFPGLREQFYSDEGIAKFYKYIKYTNSKSLEFLSFNEKRRLSGLQLMEKSLECLYHNDHFVYSATKLKYYLSRNVCRCKKMIVILDDIEPLPYEVQLQLVLQYAKYYECMRNTCEKMEQKTYIINMLISLRPHTYRILREYHGLKAFVVNREIYKKNMVSLGELFQRKIEYYKEESQNSDEMAWEKVDKVLKKLNSKYESKFAEMIKNISLCNTRDACDIYKLILRDRNWISHNTGGARETNGFGCAYVFNNVTVLRAIACGQSYIYNGKESKWIPNILYNTADKSFSYLNMCVIFLCLEKYGDSLRCGIDSLKYDEIISAFSKSFPEYFNLIDDLHTSIKYLFEKKILRKSINDTDRIETLDCPESLTKNSILYLSSRGKEIWKMLGSDSVYLELCREDSFRDYDNGVNNSESSYELLQDGKQIEIYLDLLRYLSEIIDEEKNFLVYAKEKHSIPVYRRLITKKVISSHLYCGLKKSMDYVGCKQHVMLNSERREVEKKIEELYEIIND